MKVVITTNEVTDLVTRTYNLKTGDTVTVTNGEQEVASNVMSAIRAGLKLEAIKILREYFECGLKEGKEFVDHLETKL